MYRIPFSKSNKKISKQLTLRELEMAVRNNEELKKSTELENKKNNL